mgnify:CR=1 FL=1
MISLILGVSINSYANTYELLQIYENPLDAPAVAKCKGNASCNAFVALSKHYDEIPEDYQYQNYAYIRLMANDGRADILTEAFRYNTSRSLDLLNSASRFNHAKESYENDKAKHPDTYTYARGLAVLLYIEDENGWTR